ncbi:peroxisomal biogenesis factor 11 [Cylindrobasidium torrendii FP15055 ss-10]|uniref:Peroxisomal biogenesis factor 11 n=1 Tax=Cylindrobasidium torrendii FP15055 ss-10 TaxID=1314674 RepID=A0A0D7BTB4_9AGAR|nr:peroxisomal biogenesis factor 11 [Cylindrobasidium torrendii FP15055 ss-10]
MAEIVLHPTITNALQYGNTTLGRDKAYRGIQYFARFYAWFLLSRGDKDAAAPWIAVKGHLGTARKLLRLGKPLEHLQAALKAVLAAGSTPEKVTAIARQLAYFGYLALDAFVWSNSVKFTRFSPDTAAWIQKLSNRFWLVGILCGLLNGVAKTVRINKQLASLKSTSEKGLGSETDVKVKAASLKAAQKATANQLVIDSLDVWIPATGLGLTNLNDGVLGIFGLITSIIAAQKQWQTVTAK